MSDPTIGEVIAKIPGCVVRQGNGEYPLAIPSIHDNMLDCEHIGAVQDRASIHFRRIDPVHPYVSHASLASSY